MTSAETFIAQRKESRNKLQKIEQYPAVLGDFFTQLQFTKYKYNNLGQSEIVSGSPIIKLPLPRAILDRTNVDIGEDQLGVKGSLSAGAGAGNLSPARALSTLTQGLRQAGNNLGRGAAGNSEALTKAFADASGFALFAAKAGLTALGGDDIVKGLGAGQGLAVNPFATLVFNGVNLKTHSLSWQLSPESSSDSDKIKDIIEEIKKAILPSYKNVVGGEAGATAIDAIDNGLLQYPSILNISLEGVNTDYYLKFKPCMVKSFEVNYTPEGLSILKGGKPATINIEMEIQEAKIWTAEDYGVLSDGSASSAQSSAGESGASSNTDAGLEALPVFTDPAPLVGDFLFGGVTLADPANANDGGG